MIVLRHAATATLPARYRRTPRLALAFVLLVAASIFDRQPLAHAGEGNACEREMTYAANRYDVPLAVLHAAGMTETGRRGALQPFALAIEGPSFFAANLREAVHRFDEAPKARIIDIGCIQINHRFPASRFRYT